MTSDQKEAREERVAIMTVEGMSEKDAVKYCNSKPELYGVVDANV
jgi:hypothetical protein